MLKPVMHVANSRDAYIKSLSHVATIQVLLKCLVR